MVINDATLLEAVDAIAGLVGLHMDADYLVEDVYLLAYAFPEDSDFKSAVANTCKAISFLVRGRVSPSVLKYEFDQWLSYHYQHRVGQGVKADCRIIFRPVEGGIEVKVSGTTEFPKASIVA